MEIYKAYVIFYEYIQTLINYHSPQNPVQTIRQTIMKRRIGMKDAQERMAFMLKYEGFKAMRELQTEEHQKNMHEIMNPMEKTKADGEPLTLLDLITDKRYAEIEYDSDYYVSDYYYSEEGSSDSSSEEYDSEYDDEEAKSVATTVRSKKKKMKPAFRKDWILTTLI